MIDGYDGSNFTILTHDSAATLVANGGFFIQGCHFRGVAETNLVLLTNAGMPDMATYADLLKSVPNTIDLAHEFGLTSAAIDVEAGCFTDQADCAAARTQIEAAGLTPFVYTNQGGWVGGSWADGLKLWYASRPGAHPLTFGPFYEFEPFGPWTQDDVIAYQWSDGSFQGINVDLSIKPDPIATRDTTLDFVPGMNGEQEIGNLRILYNNGVPIRRYGTVDGSSDGREAWNFNGAWQWVRHFNDQGQWDPIGRLSPAEGD